MTLIDLYYAFREKMNELRKARYEIWALLDNYLERSKDFNKKEFVGFLIEFEQEKDFIENMVEDLDRKLAIK